MMNLLEAMRIYVAVVARASTVADACATVPDASVAGFPPPETLRRVDGASSAAPTSLHRSSP
ncbi:hypothetical protein [Burkholderia sp. Bp8998]|uniref:hypothetical protein n=1 Tax=Burkholderia sp. Bp8998 TaxID=2184557 RepID=UPI000F5B147C|nr:hypothetical protein [Burkholderia sp. Bp8998]